MSNETRMKDNVARIFNAASRIINNAPVHMGMAISSSRTYAKLVRSDKEPNRQDIATLKTMKTFLERVYNAASHLEDGNNFADFDELLESAEAIAEVNLALQRL